MAKKKLYCINVVRIGYGGRTIEVEATSEKEAEALALAEAGDYEYSEHSSGYMVDKPKTIHQIGAEAAQLVESVYANLEAFTKKRKLVLFDPETVDSDAVYNFPFAFNVDKHEFHISGVVQSVYKGKFILFHLGEEFGDTSELGIRDIPVEAAIDIVINYIK
jgi:hypothetical protein